MGRRRRAMVRQPAQRQLEHGPGPGGGRDRYPGIVFDQARPAWARRRVGKAAGSMVWMRARISPHCRARKVRAPSQGLAPLLTIRPPRVSPSTKPMMKPWPSPSSGVSDSADRRELGTLARPGGGHQLPPLTPAPRRFPKPAVLPPGARRRIRGIKLSAVSRLNPARFLGRPAGQAAQAGDALATSMIRPAMAERPGSRSICLSLGEASEVISIPRRSLRDAGSRPINTGTSNNTRRRRDIAVGEGLLFLAGTNLFTP